MLKCEIKNRTGNHLPPTPEDQPFLHFFPHPPQKKTIHTPLLSFVDLRKRNPKNRHVFCFLSWTCRPKKQKKKKKKPPKPLAKALQALQVPARCASTLLYTGSSSDSVSPGTSRAESPRTTHSSRRESSRLARAEARRDA